MSDIKHVIGVSLLTKAEKYAIVSAAYRSFSRYPIAPRTALCMGFTYVLGPRRSWAVRADFKKFLDACLKDMPRSKPARLTRMFELCRQTKWEKTQ